jgi:hypothetical protein
MGKRIAAVIAIFIATSVAWAALGVITEGRTQTTRMELQGAVGELWGNPHYQRAPEVYALVPGAEARGETPGAEARGETADNPEGRKADEAAPKWATVPVEVSSSDLRVSFDLDPRRKGLLWFNTYNMNFSGHWTAVNPLGVARDFAIVFRFPTSESIYDDFTFTVNGEPAPAVRSDGGGSLETRLTLDPGQEVAFAVSYRSRGLDTWLYQFGSGVTQVRDFRLEMETDFADVDFPPRTISPSVKEQTPGGWRLVWQHENLISGFQIGLAMPQRLNPGPLASKITFFAPISLLFFFFVIFVLGVLRGVNLHPMHYFFLASAFFSFHLLFAYLVDHINLHAAFAIASLTSVGLVLSYLRIVAGNRFAFVEAGLAQLIYLVLFSYTHFLKGLTGLTVTVGAVLTLFVMMQATARVDWESVFAGGKTSSGPAGGSSDTPVGPSTPAGPAGRGAPA